jgi:drug/metabolite transporter (DMT)-like permease
MGPGLLRGLRSGRPLLQLARSLLILLTTSMFFVGITTIPLATATTIMFLTPLLVTVLSIPLLGEKVGMRRLTGVLVGFAGALVIVRPGFDDMSVGVLLVLGASLSNSFYQLVTRQVRHYDEPNTTCSIPRSPARSCSPPWRRWTGDRRRGSTGCCSSGWG